MGSHGIASPRRSSERGCQRAAAHHPGVAAVVIGGAGHARDHRRAAVRAAGARRSPGRVAARARGANADRPELGVGRGQPAGRRRIRGAPDLAERCPPDRAHADRQRPLDDPPRPRARAEPAGRGAARAVVVAAAHRGERARPRRARDPSDERTDRDVLRATGPAPYGSRSQAGGGGGPRELALTPDGERVRVLALLKRHGWNSTSFQILEPGFRYWFDGDDACVGYVDTGRAWVAAGSPVAPPERFAEVLARFAAAAAAAHRRACCFATESRFHDAAGW